MMASNFIMDVPLRLRASRKSLSPGFYPAALQTGSLMSPTVLRFQIVRFFAVLRNVQPFHLVLFAHTEAGHQVGDFKNHDGSHQREAPGEKNADQLIAYLAPVA